MSTEDRKVRPDVLSYNILIKAVLRVRSLAHRPCPTTPPARLHAHTRHAVGVLLVSRALAHFAWFRIGAALAGVHHVFDWSPDRLAGCPSVTRTSFISVTLGAESRQRRRDDGASVEAFAAWAVENNGRRAVLTASTMVLGEDGILEEQILNVLGVQGKRMAAAFGARRGSGGVRHGSGGAGGALPYAMKHLGLSAPVYATEPVFRLGLLTMYDHFLSRWGVHFSTTLISNTAEAEEGGGVAFGWRCRLGGRAGAAYDPEP
ncbi:unnamed protein product [Miscanthus lutarioriparius]|uniref:Uncharacterized protein n=1 Tax=Miscanthus lutarioriparius TaxID=422564 RepID=A0A811P071_9POAL|nr:unnamed protein product [Miscanthus lutarioriparius]